jgi:hypothetical protein
MYPRHSGLAAVKANYKEAESEWRCKKIERTWVETRAYHDRPDGDKSVIHPTRVLDVATLESQLKTATAHAKAHRIHINVVNESGTVPRL